MAKARDIPGLHADMAYAQAAAATVRVRAEEVFEHAEGVLDVGDIERVHAMRVATRRLRAMLEIYAPCFDSKELRPLLREVKDLADALGARRDPDVELLALEQFAASVGPDERAGVELFIARTRAEQAEGNARLAAALTHAEEHDLHGRLATLARSLEQAVAPAGEQLPAPASGEHRPAPTVVHGDGHPHVRIGEAGRPDGPVPGSGW
ncbi:MAG TPA: CHAD domain-containing protein [Solirubrobacteraceae bacterium]|nr:CHAD domain-containing protein [Solirubrobacteraceae bacterium]